MFFFPFKDDNPTKSTPIISFIIIGICCLVYLFQSSLSQNQEIFLIKNYGATPILLTNQTFIYWYSSISSMFLHGGLMHLGGNLLYLWIFGDNVEDEFGRFNFILFYILCGVGAVIAQILFNTESNVPMIGASGAIAGTLGAYIVLYPRAKIFVFAWVVIFVKILKIPAFIVISVWIGLQVMNVFDQGVSGVAYSAHVGGFICGVILTPFFKKKDTKIFGHNDRKSYILENIKKESSLKHIPKLGKNKKTKNNFWDL
ncbi:rhomboid family intramembrane serine protease [Hyphomicrobiales bacterium]|jgi:membrane associated rhomboid family serine protease|nr:rhomboid family intramembrane serine protease [Hyphomicrobiales bacterium]